MRTLTNFNVTINIQDNHGKTALHSDMAAGTAEYVKALLSHQDIDVNNKDLLYYTPLLLTTCLWNHNSTEISSLLMQHGATPDFPST